MRSRNSNFKMKGVAQNVLRGVGFVSVGALVLLGIIAISPITNKADAANGWDEELKNYRETASTVTLSMDSGTNSVVNAGNTNTNVGVVKRTASVTLGNTNGYSVYIRANNANLTGSNSSNTIPSVTSNSTLSQMTDKWGWNGSVGDSVTDCSLSDVFKQMTASNQTLGTGGAVSSGTKKVTMCFGTRVSEAKVADTYSNTVTLSVVAEPGRTAAFGGIANMQQMTASICSAAPYHETAQLTDTRDNKKYWVTKMLDGNCWMSQNLALDLSTNKALTSSDSDVSSSWTPGRTTSDKPTDGTTSTIDTSSWGFGDYIITDPTAISRCAENDLGLAGCQDQFTSVGDRIASSNPNFYQLEKYIGSDGSECIKTANTTFSSVASGVCAQYDSHYLAGHYYQWNAATAGTGGSIKDQNAPESICPKNWKLPNSGETTELNGKGSFYYMLQQYGVNNDLEGFSNLNSNKYNIAQLPLFFIRGGWVYPRYSENKFRFAGQNGYYWSSRSNTSYTDNTQAYYFAFNADEAILSGTSPRYGGMSLRCLVQTP